MTTPLEKFQSLLRELFQFDCADLDFGIYRIMNHKRAVIERFIVEDLPHTIPMLDGIAYSPLRAADPLTGVRGALTIPFAFRLLTEQESIAYGRNQPPTPAKGSRATPATRTAIRNGFGPARCGRATWFAVQSQT